MIRRAVAAVIVLSLAVRAVPGSAANDVATDGSSGVAAWPITTRVTLQTDDLDLCALIDSIFNYAGHVEWRHAGTKGYNP